jgi:hypothetical protein
MSYYFKTNSRPGIPLPLDGQDIHTAWCSCSDCMLDRRRAFRLDLVVILIGLAAGFAAIVGSWLFGLN